MVEATATATADRTATWLLRALIVVAASFAIGCLESWAQGFLPDALRPLSNSASGWTLVTALLVFWSRTTTRIAAVLGAISFVLLVAGYSIVSDARGFSYSPAKWSAIGLIVGPFVGVAASWLRTRDIRAALGGGLLAGIAFGDALYGLTAVTDTTGVTYWIVAGCLGLALIAVLLLRRLHGIRHFAVLAGATILTALSLAIVFGEV
jgi:hypothetical protein